MKIQKIYIQYMFYKHYNTLDERKVYRIIKVEKLNVDDRY
jgi:hypothetical protein